MLGAFALVAMVLGGIGVHGLLAFTVSARAAELPFACPWREAGQHRLDDRRRTVMLAAIGVVAGVILAYVSNHAMKSLLAGVAPDDGLTFGVAVGLAFAMAVAGSLRPAIRAARVDPVTATKME